MSYFHIDQLSILMMVLIGFISVNIFAFSKNYMSSENHYSRFKIVMSCLVISLFVLVTSDHLVLFFLSLSTSNLFLSLLMAHNTNWTAARESGKLALKNFSIGSSVLALAFILIYLHTNEVLITKILTLSIDLRFLYPILILILIAAMCQSAIWPFHGWILSSLNSPTPVSALMHAGLVNGGGFILIKFATIFYETPLMLNIIFILGITTALLGTLFKLIQSDIKRMLASSTIAQMGFMFIQCGLGLYPAAAAHLFFHGLFKAYLFLASGSAAQDMNYSKAKTPAISTLILSLLIGLFGSTAFSFASQRTIAEVDTTLFLIGIAYIAATQLSITILNSNAQFKILIAIITSVLTGAVYGICIFSFEVYLSPLDLLHPQPLNYIHFASFLALTVSWLFVVFKNEKTISNSVAWKRFYVWALNSAQPNSKTITASRNEYNF